MTVARTRAVALAGVAGRVVEVEADLSSGLPGTTITGLADTSLAEARDRVKAGLVNSGVTWPQTRLTLGLSPASLPKRGSAFDLALAGAVLAVQKVVPPPAAAAAVLIGELGLDGTVRSVAGVLPMVLAAHRAGAERVVVPLADLAEARLVPGVVVDGVADVAGLVALLAGGERGRTRAPEAPEVDLPSLPDMADVAGQVIGRTAMEVAAAGGHHTLLLGPPGSGKTMCAARLPSLLPPLDREQALEVTAVHSVAGLLPAGRPLVTRPPFQAPHHGATMASIVGGGSGLARPGAVSLAHHGVLFLDEAPEFAPVVLDALRQPLESGEVHLTRVGGTTVYPARAVLVLAANPCPCGAEAERCSCAPDRRRRYLARLSGPLLDRVDLRVEVPRITTEEILAEDGRGEPSAAIAARVLAARGAAAERLAGTPWRVNGEVPVPVLRQRWPVPRAALRPAATALDHGVLTARGFGRVLRVAWTLADLEGATVPGSGHVAMALGYRLGDGGAALGGAA